MAHDELTNDAIREGEPPVRRDRVIENQPPVHDIDRPKPRGALASVVLGLVSVAIGVLPQPLVFPLQVFLGEYPPVYLPFLTGALAFGLALRVLVRGRRMSWLAVGGLILGILGMLLGSLIAVVVTYMLIQARVSRGVEARRPGSAVAEQVASADSPREHAVTRHTLKPA
jgi:hypothetical protein